VERQGAQARAPGSVDEAPAQGATDPVAAELRGEHRVVLARHEATACELREALGDLVDHGDDADLSGLGRDDLAVGEICAHADRLAWEVDVAPAQRAQLAAPEAGEGCGEVDRAVLVVGGAADDGVDLFAAIDVVVAGVADGVALDAVDRVRGDELAALDVAQDRAEHHEDLAGGAGWS
jgi:hypothetical protein